MTRSFFALLTTLFATMACGSSQAQASFVSWSYNWTPSALALPADVPGTGGLSLTNEPTKNADGTSDVVVTNIRGFSSAARGTPDKFTHAAYSFALVLTDLASGQVAHMTFTGFFSGALSATSANIANTFTGTTTQSATLGGHNYVVTMNSYSPPGPPTASNAGSIGAHVGVDEVSDTGPPGGGPGPSNQAPEPSTLLLSCLGLSGLGVAGWRKWRGRMHLFASV